jgi:hypothetical protein
MVVASGSVAMDDMTEDLHVAGQKVDDEVLETGPRD